MKEEWKIYNCYSNNSYNGKYHLIEVSNFGNVKVDGVLLDFSRRKSKYIQVHNLYVHRMVAELFLQNPDNKPCVDHIDTDKHNNNVSNLRWVTYKENNDNPITKDKHKATMSSDRMRKCISNNMKLYYKNKKYI